MNILSFDTTNNLASTAIISNKNLLFNNTTLTSSQQAEKLFTLIDESLRESKLSLSDIDLISVTNGPGSFTGVRIGLAAALGMQIACKAKFISITNFQVLAYLANEKCQNKDILVALDARREQAYVQKFSPQLKELSEANLVNIKELDLTEDLFLIGDALKNSFDVKVDAKLLALATEFYWKCNQYHDLIPLYIRQPDITIKTK